jgi:hypothetical protein
MLRRTILAGELAMPIAGENELSALSKDPQALVRVPIGIASPLWGLFAGAAVSGAAWWWMTRWARPANLEALFGAAETATTEVAAEVKALAAPVVEAMREAPALVEPVLKAAEETVATAPELVLPAAEELIEAAPEAVGGESAPISPVVEALSPEIVAPTDEPIASMEPAAELAPHATPLPKPKKPAAPKAD